MSKYGSNSKNFGVMPMLSILVANVISISAISAYQTQPRRFPDFSAGLLPESRSRSSRSWDSISFFSSVSCISRIFARSSGPRR